MTRRLAARALAALSLATLSLSTAAREPRAAADSGGAAGLVEKEFFAAIKSVTPAAVYCVGKGGPSPGSSGVIISRDGYVLSDGDAGVIFRPKKDASGQVVGERVYPDELEVRIPDLKRGTYAVLPARVVRRLKDLDSTLLKIDKAKVPSSGLPFVVPGTSASLEVGQFTFAMGTPFGQGDGGTAALTAGIVAALAQAPEGQPGGRIQEIETTAAINPGVNGGPLVDVDGNLVGIISTWGEATPVNPFQFLGKAYPIDRIRAAYKDLPNFASIFPDPKTLAPRSKNAALLEHAILLAARRAQPAVVSLEIVRSEPFRMRVPQPLPKPEEGLARYAGPVSGVSVSKDGFIVSSLYNFASTMPIAYFGFRNDIEETLGKITSVTAHYADGTSAPAKLVAHDQRLGLVCLKAERPAGQDAPVLETASSTDALRVGRLLVAVGNPFGATRNPSPLVTVGMLSRLHPEDDEKAWRGDLQTDAGMTDGNCGGALVDIHGRLVALATIWDPAGQGRESGIGFGVPWSKVEAALPSLEQGKSVVYGGGFLGIGWAPDGPGGAIRITQVAPDGPAGKAGVQVGDVIVSIDGKPVAKLLEAMDAVRTRRPGEKLAFVFLRGVAKVELTIELGRRT